MEGLYGFLEKYGEVEWKQHDGWIKKVHHWELFFFVYESFFQFLFWGIEWDFSVCDFMFCVSNNDLAT
jgi:hypothetical protein